MKPITKTFRKSYLIFRGKWPFWCVLVTGFIILITAFAADKGHKYLYLWHFNRPCKACNITIFFSLQIWSLRSSLLTLHFCYSACMFWMPYCNVKPNCSIIKTIMVKIVGVQSFRILIVNVVHHGVPTGMYIFCLHVIYMVNDNIH